MNIETTNGHVRFDAVMDFEITEDQAADVLAMPQSQRYEALGKVLAEKYGLPLRLCYNPENLARAFGEKLARQKVEERRMLTAPMGEAVPMEKGAA